MLRLYSTVDAFVLASHGEGWGLPYMEAMAMGLPCIATNWWGTARHGAAAGPAHPRGGRSKARARARQMAPACAGSRGRGRGRGLGRSAALCFVAEAWRRPVQRAR
jgi:hypothetical protein